MDQSACSKLHALLDRLDIIVSAYSSLSWFAACSAEVPADQVGNVMVPLDDALRALRADFWAFLNELRQRS
jgi:hypothetical protein